MCSELNPSGVSCSFSPGIRSGLSGWGSGCTTAWTRRSLWTTSPARSQVRCTHLYALITLNINSPCCINFNPGPLHVDCSPGNVAYTYMFGSYRIYYEGIMHVNTLLLRGDLMVLIVTFPLQWYCNAHKEAIPPAQQGDRDGTGTPPLGHMTF